MEGIDFTKMPCIYWDDVTKISYLQRRVAVYSIMYYELNESCITDKQYDAISRQLVHLQSSVDEQQFKRTTYYYAMHDFDGSTGFDIADRLNEKDRQYLTAIATNVLRSWRNSKRR